MALSELQMVEIGTYRHGPSRFTVDCANASSVGGAADLFAMRIQRPMPPLWIGEDTCRSHAFLSPGVKVEACGKKPDRVEDVGVSAMGQHVLVRPSGVIAIWRCKMSFAACVGFPCQSTNDGRPFADGRRSRPIFRVKAGARRGMAAQRHHDSPSSSNSATCPVNPRAFTRITPRRMRACWTTCIVPHNLVPC